MTIQEILKNAGHESDFDNRNRAVRSINSVLKNSKIAISIVEKGKVKVTKSGFKYNISISLDGISRGYYQRGDVEPYDILSKLALFLKIEEVIEKIKYDVTTPHTCSKCNGTGFIPAFAHYANGVCFDCMGVGVTGVLSITRVKEPKPEVRLSPKNMTDLEQLYRIILVNDTCNLVEGVRKEAFDRALELGYLNEVRGEFKTFDYSSGKTTTLDVAYQWNTKLRYNDIWGSSTLGLFFIGII